MSSVIVIFFCTKARYGIVKVTSVLILEVNRVFII